MGGGSGLGVAVATVVIPAIAFPIGQEVNGGLAALYFVAIGAGLGLGTGVGIGMAKSKDVYILSH